MLRNEIKKFFQGEVLADPATLEKYSEDASIFKIKPEVVVFPKDVQDIKNLVKFVAVKKKSDPGISLSPRAAGTDMTGGPLTESIVVVFTKYLNRIKAVDRNYAVAEPGCYYRDFETATLKRGLLLPSYPASRGLCAIGGIVANNAGGEKTLVYGKTEDYVLETKVIFSDGNEYTIKPLNQEEIAQKIKQKNFEGKIYRELFRLIKSNLNLIKKSKPNVSKNSAGYFLWNVWDGKTFDLNKLIVGSQGTLGIITEVKFRLIRPKKHARMLVVFLKSFEQIPEVENLILKEKPESFEAYDDKTLKLAIRFMPSLIKAMGFKNALKMFFKLLPDFWLVLAGGFPKLVFLAEFTDDNEAKIVQTLSPLLQKIKDLGIRARLTPDEETDKCYWTIRRESFNLLREHVKGKHTAPFIDDVIVRPDQLSEFLPKLNAIVAKYPEFIYTIAGHAGDANFHVIPLVDFRDSRFRGDIQKVSDEVYNLVAKFGGSITAEHNDGLIRTPYLHKMYSKEMLKLFDETKKIFDPLNIFNPGKKVGGDLNYALSHIKAS